MRKELGIRKCGIEPQESTRMFSSISPSKKPESAYCISRNHSLLFLSLLILIDSDLQPLLHYVPINHPFHTCQIKKGSSAGKDDSDMLSIDGHLSYLLK